MALSKTNILYGDVGWPIVTGCSMGCPTCWARAMAHRFDGGDFAPTFHPDRLDAPLRKTKPAVVLVAFRGDLFDPAIRDEQIAAAFGVMAEVERHTFVVLTKQALRARQWGAWVWDESGRSPADYCRHYASNGSGLGMMRTAGPFAAHDDRWPLPNVWLGVSVTNQHDADSRIPDLLATPAAHRWVSVEPLVAPVDLTRWLPPFEVHISARGPVSDEARAAVVALARKSYERVRGPGLDQIVAGCESGPSRRPADPAWFRALRGQCAAASIPYLLKQMDVGGRVVELPLLDGVRHDRVAWRVG